ncbi:hypothetical protein C8035_v001864 [Colletotrichum spinosum]|uniref:Uncharacterized protein n=1 Tax=Colletotrichum spinosum TaxID=1347390 RepID=A0A4R8QCM9_9PEZI|nr:hypothetical protein C8035_v001864 [Colletotrichum spinosum]
MGSKKKRELESNAEVEEKDEVGSLVRERSRTPDDGGLVDLSYTLLASSPRHQTTDQATTSSTAHTPGLSRRHTSWSRGPQIPSRTLSLPWLESQTSPELAGTPVSRIQAHLPQKEVDVLADAARALLSMCRSVSARRLDALPNIGRDEAGGTTWWGSYWFNLFRTGAVEQKVSAGSAVATEPGF